ncbi:MAG: hypothetical protein OXN85_04605 [Gemmatimonadetes bacterium]|nr:hypothetical protein [Candidatus Palauibacter australiensis]
MTRNPALQLPSREREAILLTKEARLALIECESHASRAKSRRWAVESVAPPHRREGVEEVVESVGRAASDALDHARRAKEAVIRARRGREALAAQEAEERARRAHERRQKASRERARAEWERDRAELREHAERLRS